MSSSDRKGARFTLFMLVLVYAMNFMDRQVIVILQEPIKRDLLLADWQLGLLTGFAFAIFYTLLGVPIARFADRGNRRNIITAALTLWSFMTVLCGTVSAYWQLLLTRIGVGVGEAGCTPPAHSMISDLFAERRRGTAMSTYNLGLYVGIFMGFLGGGWLNEMVGWRLAFLAVGAPGLLLAVIFRLTVPEPSRSGVSTVRAEDAAPPTREVLRHLWQVPSFKHMALAAGLHGFAAYGVGNWLPSFFIRSHGLGTGEVATWIAPIAAIAGATGALLGGVLCDRFERRDPRWNIWIPAAAILLSVPFSIAVYLVADYRLAFVISIVPAVLGNMYLGPMIAMMHRLVSPRMRAVTSSILLLVLNLIGLGLGPWITGLLSDWLQPSLGVESLRWALVIVICVNVWCAVHYFWAARTLRQDLVGARA